MQESILMQELENTILPFYKNDLVHGSVNGKENIKLSYVAHKKENVKGALVIINGRIDSCVRHAEFLYDIKDIPYSVYILDHRGIGFSERLLDDPYKGHVDSFDNYSADLKLFIDTVVRKDDPKKIVILGYSMGGTVSLDYLINYDHNIDKLILCSPMLKFKTGLPEWIVYFIVNLLIKFNKETDYIPGGNKYDFSRVFFNLSCSEIRHSMLQYLRDLYPMIILKAPTNRWFKEAIKTIRKVRREIKKIDTPVLLLQAGKEAVVDIHSQDKLAKDLSHCHKIIIPEAKHDLLMEKDSMRGIAIKAILDFLE